MMTNDFSILLCTNGQDSTRPALEYGVWLAALLDKPVLLLGVDEDEKIKRQLLDLLDVTAQNLARQDISFEKRVIAGHGTTTIAEITKSGKYLTVVGPLGRPAWQRVVQGRSFRRLLAKVETPILYVPQTCLPLRRVLLCMGGLGYAFSLEHLSLLIAKAAGAAITLLHIVEPISLNYPTATEIRRHPDNILETDTPQAHNLRHTLDDIRDAGLTINLKVRHGNIVHEIQEEVQSGDYDLIGLGSPYSSKSLRHLYTANVTAEVAESIDRPVLAVRMGQELS